MLPWFSKRSLIWTATALAAFAAGSTSLKAQKFTGSSHTAPIASKTSPAKRAAHSAPDVDVNSVSSVEKYIAWLRQQEKEAYLRESKADRTKDEEKKEREERQSSLAGTHNKAVHPKLTRSQLERFSEEKDAESRAEYWEAYLYYLRPRAFPGNTFDTSAIARAAAVRDQMPIIPGAKANRGGVTLNAAVIPPPQPQWSTFGPPGTAGGTISWRVSGLTYDPNNPNHYFAAGSRGGVWESKDQGQSWTPIMDFQPMLPVSCVAVDVRDSNTIYIGTGEYDSPGPGFGILKGRWDGVQWSFTTKAADIIGNTPVHRITVDPFTASKIFATAGPKGLLVSTDSGGSWKVALGPNTVPAVTGSFSNVVYNSYGDRIWACADGPGGGIFESKNGGVTWANLGAPGPSGRMDIAASPVRSRRGRATLYAVYANEQLVYKGAPTPNTIGAAPEPDDLDNGAVTFTAQPNFPKTAPGARNIWDQSSYNLAIACTTTNDQVNVTDNATPIQHIGTITREVVIVSLLDLHISMDNGKLWRSGVQGDIDYPYNGFGFSGGIEYEVDQQVPGYHTDQHALAINPKNPYEFLAGCDGGAYRITFSPNAEPGFGFTDFFGNRILYEIPQPIPNPLPTPSAPPNPHDYALYEDRDNIFDWYFARNPFNSGADFPKPLASYSITPCNNGLGIAQFYFAGFHPTDPLTALGGTQDNGTQYSFGSPLTWDFVIKGDGGGCGINQFTPGIQFGSLNFKNPSPNDEPFYPILRTANGWQDGGGDATLYTGDDITAFFSTGEMSRSRSDVFYMSTNYLYEYSEDPLVQDWLKFRQQFSSLSTVSAIETTPASTKYLYVGTTDGLVWYSTDADQDPNPDTNIPSFGRIDNQGANGGLPVRSVSGLSASATDPKRLYVTLSGLGGGHVFVNADISRVPQQWKNITGNLPDISTNCICVFPRSNGQEIAVGTDVGVFYTVDGGTTWFNITAPNSLPNVQVNKLYFTPKTNFLNAATFGRGVWHIDLTKPLTSGGGGGLGNGNKPPVVTIAPYLDSYVGARSKLRMNVQVFSGATVVLNQTLVLSPAGYATITLPSIGTFDVLVSIDGFLHRRLKNQLIKVDLTLRPQLLNGDVNRDNSVTNADLTQARAKLGQFSPGPEDVNGDGSVTQNDLDIITKNLGQVGDN